MSLFDQIKESAKQAPLSLWYKLKMGLATLEDQEEALTNPQWAFWFARFIPGANIERCQEAACKHPYWAYDFAIDIKSADIDKCREACKGTEWEEFLVKKQ